MNGLNENKNELWKTIKLNIANKHSDPMQDDSWDNSRMEMSKVLTFSKFYVFCEPLLFQHDSISIALFTINASGSDHNNI